MSRAVAAVWAWFGLLLWLPTSAYAAFSPGEPFSVAPSVLLAANSPSRPAGIDVDVLFDETRVLFDVGGRKTRRVHRIYKILTSDGVSSWGLVGESYAAWYQRRPEVRARVVSPRGDESWFDASTLVEEGAGKAGETYSDVRRVRGPLPAVEAGSVVEELVTIVDERPYFAAGTVFRHWFYGGAFTQLHRLVVDAPTSLPVRYQLLGGAKRPQVQRHGGRVVWSFEYSDLRPLSRFPPATPPDVAILPAVSFSSGKDWSTVARAYASKVAEQYAAFDAKRIATSLVAQGDTEQEKARKLLEYLNTNIRYTGLELGERSLVPAEPEQVLKRRYGDCKDKAALLSALLRSVGVPAQVALLETGPGLDISTELPGLGLFDHAIVRVGGKQPLWIDPASGYSDVGVLPPADEDRAALLIDSRLGRLVRTPRSHAARNVQNERVDVHYVDANDARVVETTEARGSYALDLKMQFDAPKEPLKARLKEYANKRYGGDVSDVEMTAGAEQARLSIRVDKATQFKSYDDGAFATVFPNAMYEDLPATLFDEPETAEEKEKKKDPRYAEPGEFGIYVSRPHRRTTEYHLYAPNGFQWDEAVPEPLRLQYRGLTLERDSRRVNSGEYVVRYVVQLATRTIPSRHLKKLRAVVKKFTSNANLQLQFRHSADAAYEKGDVAESFNIHRQLVRTGDDAARARVRYAESLLRLRFGDEARRQVEHLAREFPEAARVQASVGWIASFDSLGREAYPGSRLSEARARYAMAVRLAPDDRKADSYREKLAGYLRYDDQRRLYTEPKQLREALELLTSLRAKSGTTSYDEQIMRLHCWLQDYAAADDFARGLEVRSPAIQTLWLYATMMLKGPRAVEQLAATLTELPVAGQLARLVGLLELFGEYRQVIQVLDLPALEGSELNAVATRRRYETFAAQPPGRVAKSCQQSLQPPVRSLLAIRYRLGEAKTNVDTELGRQGRLAHGRYWDRTGVRAFLNAIVPLVEVGASIRHNYDEFSCISEWKVESVGRASRIKRFAAGSNKEVATYYMEKSGASYRLVFSSADAYSFASMALDALERGDDREARTWLDWAADKFKDYGGRRNRYTHYDAFNDVWQRKGLGEDMENTRLWLAAYSLASWSRLSEARLEHLARLKRELHEAPVRLPDLYLAAAYALASAKSATASEEGIALFAELRDLVPTDRGVWLSWASLVGRAGHHAESERELRAYLQTDPDNSWGQRRVYKEMAAGGRIAEAMDELVARKDSNLAHDSEFSSLSWMALFYPSDLERAIQLGEEACSRTQNKSYGPLQTLATLYAETGQLKKATETLDKALGTLSTAEVPECIYYTLGRMAEQIELPAVARDYYGRISTPTTPEGTCWELARRRLASIAPTVAAAQTKR